jgi:hypothetical protein
MALNLGSDPRSRAGLARVIETFVSHLLNVAVNVTPLDQLEDPDWRWFVGLDQEGTRIGNALWRGDTLDTGTRERVLAVFSLTFDDPAQVLPNVGERPVYLLLAAAPDRSLQLKPHNLVVGLPLSDDREAA